MQTQTYANSQTQKQTQLHELLHGYFSFHFPLSVLLISQALFYRNTYRAATTSISSLVTAATQLYVWMLSRV